MTDVLSLSDSSDLAHNGTDNAARARTEAQDLMRNGNAAGSTAKLDSTIWPQIGFSSNAVADARQNGTARGELGAIEGQVGAENGAAGAEAGAAAAAEATAALEAAQKGAGKPATPACPGDDDYKSIIDLTARLIYEPKDLGDIKKLMEKNGCIKDTAQAVKLADEAVKVAGDPYTDVLPESEANELKTQKEGHLIGVGVQIIRPESAPGKEPLKEGPILIQRVYPNSPAEAAGLKKGDLITAVNGNDVSKMTPDEVAAKLLRGQEGTNAKISVTRDGQPKDFEMKRADYTFPSVSDKKIGDFAYIRLEDLGQNDSAEDLKAALEKHQDAKGFVLDLRDNPGGQVPQALLAASLIMEKGEILKVRSRVESDPNNPEYAIERYRVTPTGIKVTGDDPNEMIGDGEEGRMPDLVHKPLVVLTNEGTASAAEILAGALKDNNEATVIGTNTFGKGIGQQVLDKMPGNSILKVTNFRFFTPSGQWIGDGHNNRTGISPNVRVENPKAAEFGSANDAQLKAGIAKLEELTKKTEEKK